MFVATPIIMDSHNTTIAISFHAWENFVTAKSTTKISTYEILPAIRYVCMYACMCVCAYDIVHLLPFPIDYKQACSHLNVNAMSYSETHFMNI